MGNNGRKPRSVKEFFCSHFTLVGCSTMSKKTNETLRLIVSTFIGIIFGFLVGVSVSLLTVSMLNPANYLVANFVPTVGQQFSDGARQNQTLINNTSKLPVWEPLNPRGAERLPPGIVQSESDFYLRRLWGLPREDLTSKPKYLVTFTVGYDLMHNIDAAVKKFSENFTIVLFHYDGRMNEWDQFKWSKRAIHVSAPKQTKWWFAKRFLHPDIVAPYEYIFIWDEDLGVDHFDAEKYIQLVKKHGLEISQPGLDPEKWMTWEMTKRRVDREVHKETEEKPGWCKDPHLPPCAAFIEIMAPVFSGDAWRCVWHMIQNDLVHGWGLDLALQKCVEPANEKIGVVDDQWIVHKRVPSLGKQGKQTPNEDSSRHGVHLRCHREWKMFENRLKNAEKEQERDMNKRKNIQS